MATYFFETVTDAQASTYDAQNDTLVSRPQASART